MNVRLFCHKDCPVLYIKLFNFWVFSLRNICRKMLLQQDFCCHTLLLKKTAALSTRSIVRPLPVIFCLDSESSPGGNFTPMIGMRAARVGNRMGWNTHALPEWNFYTAPYKVLENVLCLPVKKTVTRLGLFFQHIWKYYLYCIKWKSTKKPLETKSYEKSCIFFF